MQLIRGLRNLPNIGQGRVLSIGNYDGVHLGHQHLLARLRQHGHALALPTSVMTFEPTPREYFSAATAPARVLTLRDKLRLLAEQGVDELLVLRFNRYLRSLSAEAFVEQILLGQLNVKALVVGDDFRFGNGRSGNVDLLRQMGAHHGFIVDEASTQMVGPTRCSSTAVRLSLKSADLKAVQSLLGAPFTISGRVRHGLKLARMLDMPTANLPLKRLPPLPLGVYAVRATVPGRFSRWPAVASVGVRPTIGTTPCMLEVHTFDNPGDLYHAEMQVEFAQFLRAEAHFESLDALKAQMQSDLESAKRWFASNVFP